MVEIVTTGNGYPLLSDPETDVAKTNRFNLLGPGFVRVPLFEEDLFVNGYGIAIASSQEFATKLNLQPIPIALNGCAMLNPASNDRFYRLPPGSVGDEKTTLTQTEDL